MRHFKAIVEYDGTDFAGFQWQHGTRTVQGVLEEAIALRTGQVTRVAGAGRTDAGVHALGQVVSFSVATRIPAERMALALNSALPQDVTVRHVEEVDAGFHARFSASSRVYAYLILSRRTPSALLRRYCAFTPFALDLQAMRQAAHYLIGEQDFAAFANELTEEQTTRREVSCLQLRGLHHLILMRIEANAFLRGMVRTIAGTLMEVGTGKRCPEAMLEILHSRDRRRAGPSAPPQGLFLLRVRYGARRMHARHHSEESSRWQQH